MKSYSNHRNHLKQEGGIIEDRMLDAIELLHYTSGYAGEWFVIGLLKAANAAALFYDLRILQMSGIRSIVITDETGIRQTRAGGGLRLLYPEPIRLRDITKENMVEVFKQCPNTDHLLISQSDADNAGLLHSAMMIGNIMNCRKVIMVTSEEEPHITFDGRAISHATLPVLRQDLAQANRCTPGKEFLEDLCSAYEQNPRDTAILNSKTGVIFREIFTFRGSGTLLSDSYSNEIRKAVSADIIDIMMIMRPEIVTGNITPMSLEEIVNELDTFYVYTVDRTIVAVCRLKEYGDGVELGKFCTLPRYQGKGRAKELVAHVLELVRKRQKKFLFSLSINPKMWAFYRNLNFTETAREELPVDWQTNYDFKRLSKAFIFALDNPG